MAVEMRSDMMEENIGKWLGIVIPASSGMLCMCDADADDGVDGAGHLMNTMGAAGCRFIASGGMYTKALRGDTCVCLA